MKRILDLKVIKESSLKLSRVPEKQRNLFLRHLSVILKQNGKEILKANGLDLSQAKAVGLSSASLERLTLNEKGIKQLALRLREMEGLQSGLGEVIEEKTNPHGLTLRKVRVPLGVIAVIYEARPEVTIDVAALCVKSGNAAILKGGSEALRTNRILHWCIKEALKESGLAVKAVNLITSPDHAVIRRLLQRSDFIDLVIARGGYGLVKAVSKQSKIPVLSHAAGGARIYVDKSADLELARKVIVNAKISKPAACNSLDTIVIHREIAGKFMNQITNELRANGVEVLSAGDVSEEDWDREFLGLTIAFKMVKDLEEAVSFINRHSKRHSEGIIARDKKVIDYFVHSIDAAALFVNCSTRLHDGYVFGLGSEVGIATGKLHARGPVGLKELTIYKWEVYGHGQIRE